MHFSEVAIGGTEKVFEQKLPFSHFYFMNREKENGAGAIGRHINCISTGRTNNLRC